jgi:hypothetical protein
MNKPIQTPGVSNPTHSFPHPQEETIKYLESRIESLSQICQELNPYVEIPNELKMRLLDYNILDLSDPFKVTNQLLILLEDTIDELHLIKPFNEHDYSVKEIL